MDEDEGICNNLSEPENANANTNTNIEFDIDQMMDEPRIDG